MICLRIKKIQHILRPFSRHVICNEDINVIMHERVLLTKYLEVWFDLSIYGSITHKQW